MKLLIMMLGLIGLMPLIASAAAVSTDNLNGLPYPLVAACFAEALEGQDMALNQTLKRRNKNGMFCCPVHGQNWQTAQVSETRRCIGALTGRGAISIGGRSCARISCSHGSAVFLCNDNSYEIHPNAPYLASYAIDINNQCWTGRADDTGESMYACGQEFDSDGYNIIVRHDNC